MIAGLPMYDRPELAPANDRLWREIRVQLAARSIGAPDRLTRGIDPWELWRRDDLVLAQTCGLPYRTRLHDRVNLVATPVHDLPCAPGHYYSVIVSRRSDRRETPAEFDGAILALNDDRSQSGWAAPNDWAGANGIEFGGHLVTGAHVGSARAVAEGRADLAALDAQTWQQIRRFDAFAAELKEVAVTDPTPALPYISALDRGPDIAAALQAAIAALDAGDRSLLGLTGVTRIAPERYLAVATPARLQD